MAASYADKLALYEKLVATIRGLKRRGATMPYTAMNGNMYSLFTKEGTLALRLPENERRSSSRSTTRGSRSSTAPS